MTNNLPAATVSRSLEIAVAQIDVSGQHLLRLVKDFSLTEANVYDMIEIVLEHGAKPRRILELSRDHDCNLQLVDMIYSVRNVLSSKEDTLSLELLGRLIAQYGDYIDLSSESGLLDFVRQILDASDEKYMGTAITKFMLMAEEYGNDDPLFLLQMLEDGFIYSLNQAV